MSAKSILILLLISFAAPTVVFALRDPTRPPGVSETSGKIQGKGGLVLNGVIHSKKRNIAIINGKKLEVGDMINGNKLLKIEKTAVYIENADGKKKLSIIRHH